MANPRPDDDLRPDAQDPADKTWRERFPGWETYERRPNDPRFASRIDPKRDLRFDTNLNPAAVVRRPGTVVWVLGITLGIVMFVLLAFWMYRHFQTPSPRSPQAVPSGMVVAPAPARIPDSVADNALPLRKEHHIHEVASAPDTTALTQQKSPAPKLRRASSD